MQGNKYSLQKEWKARTFKELIEYIFRTTVDL